MKTIQNNFGKTIKGKDVTSFVKGTIPSVVHKSMTYKHFVKGTTSSGVHKSVTYRHFVKGTISSESIFGNDIFGINISSLRSLKNIQNKLFLNIMK